MKYSLSLKEIPRGKPEVFPEGILKANNELKINIYERQGDIIHLQKFFLHIF